MLDPSAASPVSTSQALLSMGRTLGMREEGERCGHVALPAAFIRGQSVQAGFCLHRSRADSCLAHHGLCASSPAPLYVSRHCHLDCDLHRDSRERTKLPRLFSKLSYVNPAARL